MKSEKRIEFIVNWIRNYCRSIKKQPVKLKLKNKSIEYGLLSFPDFYFGKGYTVFCPET